mmetsp:Transcript_42971/g.127422  ORF Transcript_42971/g.127422 Transcript_42971/m.127422 type:complete len:259 (-) Transcript_42971:191-967(-)
MAPLRTRSARRLPFVMSKELAWRGSRPLVIGRGGLMGRTGSCLTAEKRRLISHACSSIISSCDMPPAGMVLARLPLECALSLRTRSSPSSHCAPWSRLRSTRRLEVVMRFAFACGTSWPQGIWPCETSGAAAWPFKARRSGIVALSFCLPSPSSPGLIVPPSSSAGGAGAGSGGGGAGWPPEAATPIQVAVDGGRMPVRRQLWCATLWLGLHMVACVGASHEPASTAAKSNASLWLRVFSGSPAAWRLTVLDLNEGLD